MYSVFTEVTGSFSPEYGTHRTLFIFLRFLPEKSYISSDRVEWLFYNELSLEIRVDNQ